MDNLEVSQSSLFSQPDLQERRLVAFRADRRSGTVRVVLNSKLPRKRLRPVAFSRVEKVSSQNGNGSHRSHLLSPQTGTRLLKVLAVIRKAMHNFFIQAEVSLMLWENGEVSSCIPQ